MKSYSGNSTHVSLPCPASYLYWAQGPVPFDHLSSPQTCTPKTLNEVRKIADLYRRETSGHSYLQGENICLPMSEITSLSWQQWVSCIPQRRRSLNNWHTLPFHTEETIPLLPPAFHLHFFLGTVAKFMNVYHIQMKQGNTFYAQIFLNLTWGSIPINPSWIENTLNKKWMLNTWLSTWAS